MGKVYIYMRVSTDKQDIQSQWQTIEKYLKDNNVDNYEIYKDEGVSGSTEALKRKAFKELYDKLEEGDTLIVSELTRLGRNLSDVIKLLDDLVNKKKVRIISVKEHLDSAGDKMYFKIFSTIISLFADLEREFIRMRTREGLERARKMGKRIGRPPAFDETKEKMLIEYLRRGYKIKDIARLLGVSRSTVHAHIKKMEQEGRLIRKQVIEVRK